MSNLTVADVGNSRIKWGRCDPSRVVDAVSLPLDDPQAWRQQINAWSQPLPGRWAVAGVNPRCLDTLVTWIKARGDTATVIDSYRQLPVHVKVDHPEQVGLDRLLNAVAASQQDGPAIIIDAGSAVTVDWVDEDHVFRGGAILPGLRLMSQALHSYTAKLPLLELTEPPSAMPGTSTAKAIGAGVFAAVAGGVSRMVKELESKCQAPVAIYLTGGDARRLAPLLEWQVKLWPWMTLEGIRLTALRLP